MLKSNEKWRKMTQELIVRQTECILENRFLDVNGQSDDSLIIPENYTFQKEFSGKFGSSKDLENFPDYDNVEAENCYSLSFFLKPLSSSQKSRDNPNSKSVAGCKVDNDIKILEVWNISLEIYDEVKSKAYVHDEPSLVECYDKILKVISTKCKELPLFNFDIKEANKIVEFNHMFDYELYLNKQLHVNVGESNISTSCNTQVSPRIKKNEFKFDIGLGKLIFQIDYVSKNSLNMIHDLLMKMVSHKEEAKISLDEFLHDEYFEDDIHSTISSRQNSHKNDSDEFVLITTYENLEDEIQAEKEANAAKLVPKQEARAVSNNTIKEIPAQPELAKKESSEGYKFDNKMLFSNNKDNKFKFSSNEDYQRDR